MMHMIRRHTISFRHAVEGIIWVIKTQPNFRIHLILATAALVTGFWLRITPLETTVIIFTILLGLIAEMLNTSVEAMTDLITQEYRVQAKIAKDVAAGMMLLTAIGAIGVAVCIFWPYLKVLL